MIDATATYEGALTLTLEEISLLVSARGEPNETLQNIVRLIQNRMSTDVCSVYLLETDRRTLALAATVGLRADSVGRIRMGIDEGLVGLVAQQVELTAVENAFQHPRFKYFKEAGEDEYHSFLGVPLVDRGLLQGVLVVQTVEPRSFSADETEMLAAVGVQLEPIISEARAMSQFAAPAYQNTRALSRNLWWSWDKDTTSLFREISPVRWRELGHNPIALLSEISIDKLEQTANQLMLHSRINYAYRRLQEYLRTDKTWAAQHASVLQARPVAYFSAEFGLHESIPIYSGGLGVLAGDHLKSASDLGIPLTAIGLFYDQGYFRQRVDLAGWQQEEYIDTDVRQLPMEPALGPNGEPVTINIETRTGGILARVWKVAVGRITLMLLDSDVDGNQPEDRELTARLYGGDTRVRIRQELLLGVGGVRVLRAMGILPGVLHLNEGHSAFAVLEMIRQRRESEGITFDEAARRVTRQTVFTTHTPVPAGHDRFSADLIEEHLGPLRDALGLSHEHLMSLGRVNGHDHGETFCMTVLALRLSRRANAVSSLHGEVSRGMWTSLWPGRSEEEVPIGHITNGIHVPSWLAPQMHEVYDRHLGVSWPQEAGEPRVWEGVDKINDGELWEVHQALKSRLLAFVRRRAVEQAEKRGEAPDIISQLKRALSPDALTIGFARRFATYKRSNLAFFDIDRIAALVNDPRQPVQFIFAGKAHPHDMPGKRIMQQINELARSPKFLGKVVYIEDYDINTCRHMIQGVDVWLNNPRRPLEASGTSGQKVVLNGGLNLSILDGWWAEAYDGANGFAIGLGEEHANTEMHDKIDAEALQRVMKDEVVPLFYKRDGDGLPREWIARMKRAIRTLGWRFSADRMVMDYVQKCYIPAAGGTSSDMTRS
ncbi:MAG: alpha-glucan family phosphorylase [Pirellulales bacterium]